MATFTSTGVSAASQATVSGQCVITLSGVFTGVVYAQVSLDGGESWPNIAGTPLVRGIAIPQTVNIFLQGSQQIRLYCSSYTTGTLTYTITPAAVPSTGGPTTPGYFTQLSATALAFTTGTVAWAGTSLVSNPLTSQNATFTGGNTGTLWSSANDWQITDNMNAGTGAGNNFNGLSMRVYPGSAAKVGNTTAINSSVVMGSTTGNTQASGHSAAYGPIQGYFISSVNDNGTSGTAWGAAFGLNTVTQLLTGATYWSGVQGAEFDIGVNTGASVVYKVGIQIVLASGDATHGSVDDVALAFNNQYAQGSGAGWNTLIGIGRTGGQFPAASTGTLMTGAGPGSAPFGTMAHGFKLRNITWTSDWIDGPGLTISGAGIASFDAGIVLGGTTVTATPVNITTTNGSQINIVPQGTASVGIQAASLFLGTGAAAIPVLNNSIQILEGRQTGWGTPTGTLSRAAFATGGVSTATVAEVLGALITDLLAHGLIGP